MKRLLLLGTAFLLASSGWATTYYGGFEDLSSKTDGGSDYDYNDIVFNLTGSSLSLNTSTGKWFTEPTLGTSGSPFWNNASWDGANMNIGYCIYGGGNCNHGTALDPGARYLATGNGGSVGDVTFSTGGYVDADIDLHYSSDLDVLGWFLLSDPSNIHWLPFGGIINSNGQAFGIAAENLSTHQVYDSDCFSSDNMNHFAWFATPEPGNLSLLAIGLVVLGLVFRRRVEQTVN